MISPAVFALEEVAIAIIVVTGLGFPAWFPWLVDKLRGRKR